MKIDIMKASLANIPIATLGKDNQITAQTIKDTEKIYSHTIMSRFIVTLNDIYLTLIMILFFIFWEIKSQ